MSIGHLVKRKVLNGKNGMLYHSLGAVIFSLQHFIAPALDVMPFLPSRQGSEAIKALNSRTEQSIAAMKRKISSPILISGVHCFVNLRVITGREF